MSARRLILAGLLALAAPTAALAGTHGDATMPMAGHSGGPAQAAAAVSMSFSSFSPGHLDILSGDQVTWTNNSVRVHTVTATDDSWDSGRVAIGETFKHPFETPGHYTYYCRLHTFGGDVDVHTLLLDQPSGAGGPDRPRDLTGRAALAGGTDVTIERDTGQGFTPIGGTTVAADGGIRFAISPHETASYRAVAGETSSQPVRVLVLDRRVSASARSSRRHTIVTATVAPASPGTTAVLQLHLRYHFGWWPVARGHVDRASRVRFRIPGGRRVRARVVLTLADGATPTAISPTFNVGRR